MTNPIKVEEVWEVYEEQALSSASDDIDPITVDVVVNTINAIIMEEAAKGKASIVMQFNIEYDDENTIYLIAARKFEAAGYDVEFQFSRPSEKQDIGDCEKYTPGEIKIIMI